MTQRIEYEHGDISIEGCAIIGHAMVLAMHRACGRAQAAAAGVFEAFARFERRLLAHHAIAFDFFRHTVGIVDIPCARDDLGGDVARIRDRHGISKAKHAHTRRRLRRQVLRADGDGELRSGHPVMVTLRRKSDSLVCRELQMTGLAFFDSEFEQGGAAVEAVCHFAVGHGEEEGHHAA